MTGFSRPVRPPQERHGPLSGVAADADLSDSAEEVVSHPTQMPERTDPDTRPQSSWLTRMSVDLSEMAQAVIGGPAGRSNGRLAAVPPCGSQWRRS